MRDRASADDNARYLAQWQAIAPVDGIVAADVQRRIEPEGVVEAERRNFSADIRVGRRHQARGGKADKLVRIGSHTCARRPRTGSSEHEPDYSFPGHCLRSRIIAAVEVIPRPKAIASFWESSETH